MSYTKTTDFAAKDALVTGNPAKVVKGTELDDEFNAIAVADALNVKTTALGTGVETFLGTPSSANLLAAVTNETGTGALVFATSPTLVTPLLGVPTSGTLTNCTGLPISTGVSGLGTGVATALAVNVGSAGAAVVFNGALGTPSSGTVTNLTGTAAISITGTVRTSSAATSGYGTGAGGAVTQATDRTTAVTLDKPCGAITMVSAAGSATWASFLVNNSLVTATDTIALSVQGSGATNTYVVSVAGVAAGAFYIAFATTGGTAIDAPIINFSIIKAVTS